MAEFLPRKCVLCETIFTPTRCPTAQCCSRACSKKWDYLTHKDRWREHGKRRRALKAEEIRAYAAQYREAHRAHLRTIHYAWRIEHQDRVRAQARAAYWRKRRRVLDEAKWRHRSPDEQVKHLARVALHQAIARGDLVRPTTCSTCGALCRPDAHHADYAKPLEVEWLCRPCHGRKHALI